MKMIDHNHFICHLILGTFTEYPEVGLPMIKIALSFSSREFDRAILLLYSLLLILEFVAEA